MRTFLSAEETMNGRNNFRTAALVLSIAFTVFAGGAQAQQVVKIGFASPLTGPQANYGKDNQNGAQMAIDELNAQNLTIGGKKVTFQLVAEDDQAEPSRAR